MKVLSKKIGEHFQAGKSIFTILKAEESKTEDGEVCFGIDAPPGVSIEREENQRKFTAVNQSNLDDDST